MNPWDVHPDLTLTRLQALNTVLKDRSPAERRRAVLEAAARWPWLTLINADHPIVFRIGAVPIQVVGSAIPEDTSQLALPFDDARVDIRWRLDVAADPMVLMGLGRPAVHFPMPTG